MNKNVDFLVDIIGELDEKYIEEAENNEAVKGKKSFKFKWYYAVAAVFLCVLVISSMMLYQNYVEKNRVYDPEYYFRNGTIGYGSNKTDIIGGSSDSVGNNVDPYIIFDMEIGRYEFDGMRNYLEDKGVIPGMDEYE